MMGRHSPSTGRRFWRRRRAPKAPDLVYLDTPSREHLNLRPPDWAEPTEAEMTQWVKDITDPHGWPALGDPPVAHDVALDDTRFDLIRVHPYLPLRERGQWTPTGWTAGRKP